MHLSVPVAVPVMSVTNIIRLVNLLIPENLVLKLIYVPDKDSLPNLAISVLLFVAVVCTTALEPCLFPLGGFAFLSVFLLVRIFPVEHETRNIY